MNQHVLFFIFKEDDSFLLESSNNSSLSGSGSNSANTANNNIRGLVSNGSAYDVGDYCLYERFAEMEKKLVHQADEIVCLKSTLADVLRRLSHLEGRGKRLLKLLRYGNSWFLSAVVATSHNQLNGHSALGARQSYGGGRSVGGSTLQYQKGQLSNRSSYLTDPNYDGSISVSPSPSSNYRFINGNQHPSSAGPTKSSSFVRTSSSLSSTNLKQMKRWSSSQESRLSSLENSR